MRRLRPRGRLLNAAGELALLIALALALTGLCVFDAVSPAFNLFH